MKKMILTLILGLSLVAPAFGMNETNGGSTPQSPKKVGMFWITGTMKDIVRAAVESEKQGQSTQQDNNDAAQQAEKAPVEEYSTTVVQKCAPYVLYGKQVLDTWAEWLEKHAARMDAYFRRLENDLNRLEAKLVGKKYSDE